MNESFAERRPRLLRPHLVRSQQRYAIIGALALIIFVMFGPVTLASAGTSVPVIEIHAARFAFTPPEITLKQGQSVELIFVADDAEHGIVVKGLGIDLDLPKHKRRKIFLKPDAAGDFAGECSHYCGRGHSRMTFVVHVQP